MSSARPNHPPRPGFTLIELLVVLAIVSLLIAILLPSLAAAKRRAIELQCMTQVRTLLTAALGYTSDNKGALPFAGHFKLRMALPNTSRVLLKQYGANNESFFCPAAADRFTRPSWNFARTDDYVDDGENLISYLYFGGWTNHNANEVASGRSPNDNSWPAYFVNDNGSRKNRNETAPTVRFYEHDKLSERPIWIDNAVALQVEEGGTWKIPSNNHIREFLNTSIGEHVGYADGHVTWINDPHTTRPIRWKPRPDNILAIHW